MFSSLPASASFCHLVVPYSMIERAIARVCWTPRRMVCHSRLTKHLVTGPIWQGKQGAGRTPVTSPSTYKHQKLNQLLVEAMFTPIYKPLPWILTSLAGITYDTSGTYLSEEDCCAVKQRVTKSTLLSSSSTSANMLEEDKNKVNSVAQAPAARRR
jgi:hypothetical protein